MKTLLAIVLAASAAFAAEDAWAKVKALKSGSEIRIVKRGSAQPLIGKFDELREDSLVVVVKNEQSAIPLEQIERLDYRPQRKGGKLITETKTKEELPDERSNIPSGMGSGAPRPSTSSSSNITVGSKPDFETIYRRTEAPAAAKPAK
jgi:hypothetical protein